MVAIIGISGSLRKHSFNAGLLRAAAEAVPDGCTMMIESIYDIPLYNADVEEENGIPTSVDDLKECIADADGLLLVTPEYNNSIPGVLKNAMDWLSRPPKDRKRVFGNLPIGLMGATPGTFGTAFSQYAWLPVLRALGTQVWSGKLLRVSGGTQKFDNQGNLVDESVMKQLTSYMNGFVDFVKHIRSS
jgi:NAD(P)H-dependent FMN reductase